MPHEGRPGAPKSSHRVGSFGGARSERVHRECLEIVNARAPDDDPRIVELRVMTRMPQRTSDSRCG